ncbi:hypothetical protein M9H77_04276 [Catharanthus roseus]|uniref:Uncharacterized protein n=1 Tax=Catharanthus roseus TaxID=4058 RepID=A0ACC0CDI6_CATRO|nr:hypothetical protein M9H77_04276 [Catharanthus roseus]
MECGVAFLGQPNEPLQFITENRSGVHRLPIPSTDPEHFRWSVSQRVMVNFISGGFIFRLFSNLNEKRKIDDLSEHSFWAIPQLRDLAFMDSKKLWLKLGIVTRTSDRILKKK